MKSKLSLKKLKVQSLDFKTDKRPLSQQIEQSESNVAGNEIDKSESCALKSRRSKKGAKKNQQRGKKGKQDPDSKFEVVEPTPAGKKRRECELEHDKKRKIEDGFYQERSDEDDTLEPVRSLKEEKSDEFSLKKPTYKMPEVRRFSAGCTDVVRVLLGSNNSLYEVYNSIDVFLDVENAIPSSEEKLLYDRVEIVLNEAKNILADLKSYSNGGSENVRQAIRNPDDIEIQNQTFKVLSSFYERERRYYEIGQQIKAVVPDLLWFLCKGPECPAAQIEKCQALSVQLARVIDYVHRFDCARMETPALLNDLSYYRRMLASNQYISTPDNDFSEETYKIHSFLSDATPYLNILIGVTSNFADEIKLTSNITDTLVTFIYICRHMLDRKANLDRLSPETQNFFTRVMVGALILYDHTDPNGAFCRHSPIDIRTLVNVVKNNENYSERLLNSIRYTTKHFNEPTTPKAVKTALS